VSFGYSVYFTERARNRVIRWDPDSGDADVIAGEPADGDPSQKLNSPYGLVFDTGGSLLIADKLNHRICRLRQSRLEPLVLRDEDGHRARLPDSWVHYDSTLRCPTGLFIEQSGTLLCTFADDYTVYRVHQNGRLEHLLGILRNRNYHFGALRQTAPINEVKDVPLNGPTGIVARKDGTLYFIERMPQVVRCFRPQNGLSCVFPAEGAWERGRRGLNSSTASFDNYHPAYPGSLAVDTNDDLYTTDIVQGVVLKCDLVARTVTKVLEISKRSSAFTEGPAALAFGPDGTAWILNTVTHSVEAFEAGPSTPWKAKGIRLSKVNGQDLRLPIAGSGLALGK